MANNNVFLALDVGEKRIGVAIADSAVRIAIPHDTILVDGSEVEQIAQLIVQEKVAVVVVGYPRNQSGEPTAQTAYAESFAKQLEDIAPKIVFQDESLTSVKAEEYLVSQRRPYEKGDIDAMAASIILQDYLEDMYGRF
ncbi:MAG: Holliday junction resolvase RuvX [Candidatus Saccharimonas sp.]